MATVDTFPIYKGERVCRINVGDHAVLADMLAAGWSLDQPAVEATTATDPAPRRKRAPRVAALLDEIATQQATPDPDFKLDGL